ncbi:MAG: HEAT repeat domain-containing protein [Chloroflexi bacterium]|nr:HEAT repeat domain-containing protein [Chloroflexota bacterium]
MSNVSHSTPPAETTLRDLITTLTGKDGPARKRARDQLVEIGLPAVAALLPLLSDKRTYVRWEAAKALSEIGDPGAAPALVKALEDNDPGIRWLAAEGLILAEQAGLPPLLKALLEHGGSVRVREGADHVLKVLARNEKLPAPVAPVLQALHGTQPAIEAPQAAKIALEALAS